MDKNQKNVLAIGALAAVGLALIDIFYALIAIVVVLALLMSIQIMGDSGNYPSVVVGLEEDAKGLTVVNKGNAEAKNIHVTIVPINIEFDIPSLKPDEQSEFGLPSMLSEAKAVVTYENAQGQKYMRSYALAALGGGDEDILRPVFPIFGWK